MQFRRRRHCTKQRLDPGNEKAANVGAQRITDTHGWVAFDVWPISDYRLVAFLYSQTSGIPPTCLTFPPDGPFSAVVALKGFA